MDGLFLSSWWPSNGVEGWVWSPKCFLFFFLFFSRSKPVVVLCLPWRLPPVLSAGRVHHRVWCGHASVVQGLQRDAGCCSSFTFHVL